MAKMENLTLDKFIEQIHLNIHALRLIPNYNPSEFEKKINLLVINIFKDTCQECKQKSETLSKLLPQQKSKFWEVLLGG